MVVFNVMFSECKKSELEEYLTHYPKDREYFEEENATRHYKAQTFCYLSHRLGIVVFEEDDFYGKYSHCKKSFHIYHIYFFKNNPDEEYVEEIFPGGKKGIVKSIIEVKLRSFDLKNAKKDDTFGLLINHWKEPFYYDIFNEMTEFWNEKTTCLTDYAPKDFPIKKCFHFMTINEKDANDEWNCFDWAFFIHCQNIVQLKDYYEKEAEKSIVIPKRESGLFANILDVQNYTCEMGLMQYAVVQANKNEELDFKNVIFVFFTYEDNPFIEIEKSDFTEEELDKVLDYLMENKTKLLERACERDKRFGNCT